jgi:hypothetical protein
MCSERSSLFSGFKRVISFGYVHYQVLTDIVLKELIHQLKVMSEERRNHPFSIASIGLGDLFDRYVAVV